MKNDTKVNMQSITAGITEFCSTNSGLRLIKILKITSENVAFSTQASYLVSFLNGLNPSRVQTLFSE
jgi:hypothetical protein